MNSSTFHWIFVSIAGAFILLLFFAVINTGTNIAQKGISAELLQNIEVMFASFTQLKPVTEPIRSSEGIELEMVCEGDVSQMALDGISKDLSEYIVFSQNVIEGDTYYLKTMELNSPFTITSALYITDSNTLFVLLTDNNVVKDFYTKLLPKDANIRVFKDAASINHNGFDRVVIFSEAGGQIERDEDLLRKDVVQVRIDKNRNQVYFYEKTRRGIGFILENTNTPDVDVFSYPDSAFLLGAIMSDSAASYKCNIDKFEKLRDDLRAFMAARTTELQTQLSDKPFCESQYEGAKNELKSSSYDPNRLEQINSIIITKCPTIY